MMMRDMMIIMKTEHPIRVNRTSDISAPADDWDSQHHNNISEQLCPERTRLLLV